MVQKRQWCARCKVEIQAERAAALADTRLCVACSQAVGGEFVVFYTTESLGKSGSLKKNYGGIESIIKQRKPVERLD